MDNTLSGIAQALQAAVAEAVKTATTPVEVDITRFFKHEEGQRICLQWKNPSIKDVYKIGNDARELKKRYPLWNEQLAVDVATVAACHVWPNPGDLAPGFFYATIADGPNDKLWYEIMRRLGQEFPHLRETSLPLIDELLDVCALLYSRHPSEFANVSSEAMAELMEAAQRRAARTSL